MKLETKPRRIKDLFGFEPIEGRAQEVRIFENDGNEHIPVVNENFIFTRELVNTFYEFLVNPKGKGLWLFGPTGSGKTETVRQFCARLNIPCYSMDCTAKTDIEDKVGLLVYTSSGKMEFVPLEIYLATKNGGVLLINEITQSNPGVQAFLFDLIQRTPFLCQQTGELVKIHKNFRLIATDNTNGFGDETGLYKACHAVNIALLDRFSSIEVGYPEPDVEEAILHKATGGVFALTTEQRSANLLAEEKHRTPTYPDLVKMMVRFANDVRARHFSDGVAVGTLARPLSTRNLVVWAQDVRQHAADGQRGILSSYLDFEYANQLPREEKDAVHSLGKTVFGDVW